MKKHHHQPSLFSFSKTIEAANKTNQTLHQKEHHHMPLHLSFLLLPSQKKKKKNKKRKVVD